MFVMKSLQVNEKGNLSIGGVDTTELAKEYGTPLYVYDETTIRDTCRIMKKAIKDNYSDNGLPLFACKSFMCKALVKVLQEEKMGLCVASGGELYAAKAADFDLKDVYFHGNNKTDEELQFAVSSGVGRIVVDNEFELSRLDKIAKTLGAVQKILFRIKPGIDAHTHDFIKTGQIDSKFGTALETGEAMEIVKHALTFENVEVMGLHCHIGSQIFDTVPFGAAAEVMLQFIADIKTQTGIEIKELDLGGGFGVQYTSNDDPKPYNEYIETAANALKLITKQKNITLPKILIEPGRSISAPAGLTLYTVGAIKPVPGYRTYLLIDGGMNDNPRYALYKSSYDALIANKASQKRTDVYTIAGRACESGDLIQEGIKLQSASSGDILAVLVTGAYNYTMSMNYNRFCRPAIVFVKDGESRLVVRRETPEDLLKTDLC